MSGYVVNIVCDTLSIVYVALTVGSRREITANVVQNVVVDFLHTATVNMVITTDVINVDISIAIVV